MTPYLSKASTAKQRAAGQADPGKPLPVAGLVQLIAAAHRPPVARRDV